MLTHRLVYSGVLVFTAALLFFFGSAYMLALLALELLVPFLGMLLLRADARVINLTVQAKTACVKGQQNGIVLVLHSNRTPISAGTLDVTLQLQNRLLGAVRYMRVRIPVCGRHDSVTIPFNPELCGEAVITCEDAVCTDLFRLFSAHLGKCRECRVMVYPEQIPLILDAEDFYSTQLTGEHTNARKRGNDASEVFDLREYRPGDDMRSIHWKLTGKLQKTIVREASDTLHYDTMLLIDASAADGTSVEDKKTTSAAVELAMNISERMLDLGLSHCVAAPINNRLELFPIMNRADFSETLDLCMSMTLPSESKMGLKHFAAGNYKHEYNKLIYVTADSFSPAMARLLSASDVTAICTQPPGSGVKTARDGACRMFEIAVDKLYDNSYKIQI